MARSTIGRERSGVLRPALPLCPALPQPVPYRRCGCRFWAGADHPRVAAKNFVTITLDRYGHLMPDGVAEAGELLAARLERG
jgi:hypothetical protein